MALYSFGPGVLYGVNSAANSTPVRFGALQDVSVDFSFTVKELAGSYQFPLAIARGKGKITCKAKAAQINGNTLNQIFFGLTSATGKQAVAVDEAATIPASTPWTVTAANGATFIQDLGVQNANTGLFLTKVASAPTTGQYSVNSSGVYTFASADASTPVRLNYSYTVAASGNKIVITNQMLGTTPLFQAAFTTSYLGKAATFTFPQCTASKLTFSTKLEDFVIPEFDFSVFADATNTIGTLSFDE